MATLPFLRKKDFHVLLLLLFFMFFSFGNIFSQTVIKEKVGIEPKFKMRALNTAVSEKLYTVNFTATWESDVQGAIEICGVNSGWIYGGASLSIKSLCQPSFIGAIKLNIPEFEVHSFNYSLVIVGITDTSGTGNLVGTNPSVFLGWPPAAYIDLPIKNYSSYSVGLWNESLTQHLDQLCNGIAIVPWPNFYFGCDPITDLIKAEYIKLKIEPEVQGVSFYSRTWDELGPEITVKINECTQYRISLNDAYENINQDTIFIKSEIAGIQKTDSIIVPGTDYSLRPVDYDSSIILSRPKIISIEAVPSSCLNIPLPHSIKYTAEIIKSANIAVLRNMYSGEMADTLNLLDHNYGQLDFGLIGDGDLVKGKDTIIVKISTTSTQIEPIELSFIPQEPNLVVTFSPVVIAPGDTATVVLKKKNADGTLSDLPQDQTFDVQLAEGADYGTLYFPDWDYMSDQTWGTSQNIKFIAEQEIPGNTVQSTLLVNTSSGGIATAVVPGKGNSQKKFSSSDKQIQSLKKIRSTQQEDEVLCGSGTITITKNTSHIKAYFEKDSLSPGDTVIIIVKNVDKDGNETDYPPETDFEVAVIKGCGIGLINGTNSHVTAIKQPIKFVVSDPINTTDSVVVLRVGAPEVETSNAIVQNLRNKIADKTKGAANKVATAFSGNEKMRSRKTTDEASCTAYAPIYSNTSDARAVIENDNYNIVLPQLHFDGNGTDMLGRCGNGTLGYTDFWGVTEGDNRNMFNSSNVSVYCNNNIWKIKIEPDNMMHINYDIVICTEEISRRFSTILKSTADINDIPPNLLCDWKWNKIYPLQRYPISGDVYIDSLTEKHEGKHAYDFMKLAWDVYSGAFPDLDFNFSKEYSQFHPHCNTTNESVAKSEAGLKLNEMMKIFKINYAQKAKELFGSNDNDPKRKIYEQGTQDFAFGQIGKRYIDAIDKRINSINKTRSIKNKIYCY